MSSSLWHFMCCHMLLGRAASENGVDEFFDGPGENRVQQSITWIKSSEKRTKRPLKLLFGMFLALLTGVP